MSELTWLDRRLQRARIAKATDFLGDGARVLDVGCADGALFRARPDLSGLGIDPAIEAGTIGTVELRRGHFPDVLADDEPFDAICALAVLEHIGAADQQRFVASCRAALRPKGRVILTIPAPLVDRILDVLIFLKLLKGMEAEEHWGFAPEATVELFERGGFSLDRHRRFEAGLNHLFVFIAE